MFLCDCTSIYSILTFGFYVSFLHTNKYGWPCISLSDGPYVKLVILGYSHLLLEHSGFSWWLSFTLAFQLSCLRPKGSTDITIRCFCRVLISDSCIIRDLFVFYVDSLSG